jgi:ubiquinone biosynthesis protein
VLRVGGGWRYALVALVSAGASLGLGWVLWG